MGNEETAAIDAEMARGEYLAAADLALAALTRRPDDPQLVWRAGLALARCGATTRAERLLDDRGVGETATDLPSDLQEDLQALRARLTKDRALAATGEQRSRLALEAAYRYAEIGDRFASHYATVNAATLQLVAGRPAPAAALAATALERASGDDYWTEASRAEAHLVRGAVDDATAALGRAAATGPDPGMRSTTVRQLRLVCELAGVEPTVLDALPTVNVAHLAGHMFADGPEERIRASLVEIFAERRVGVVVGSVACGADLVAFETALALGLEARVVLPCPADDFVARSVAPGGARWVDRFRRVLEEADAVEEEPTLALDDETMFAYGDQLAMGFALVRAEQLAGEALQIAMWDGAPPSGLAGTAAAVAAWRELGGETVVVDLPRADLTAPAAPTLDPIEGEDRPRGIKAMLFADVTGFSGLTEQQLPSFFEGVMAALARELDAAGESLHYRNTWGDALYLVFDDPGVAARTARRLQERTRALADELAWPSLALRIGGHAGPVFDGFDHVCGVPTFYGTHVTRAARIEPTTPAGEVYVTAAFAALAALGRADDLRFEYVGHVPTAKEYGAFPMYLVASDPKAG